MVSSKLLKMKVHCVQYLGFATADVRFSNAMIPWVIAEIKKGGVNQKVIILLIFIF